MSVTVCCAHCEQLSMRLNSICADAKTDSCQAFREGKICIQEELSLILPGHNSQAPFFFMIYKSIIPFGFIKLWSVSMRSSWVEVGRRHIHLLYKIDFDWGLRLFGPLLVLYSS